MHSDNRGSINTIESPVIEFSKTVINEEKKKVLRGRLWISPWYYGKDGSAIKKEELFIKDYEKLVRWIKKNVPYQQIKAGDYVVKEYASDEIVALQEDGFCLTISL